MTQNTTPAQSELESLILALRDLYSRVSSALLKKRLEPVDAGGAENAEVHILDVLNDRIDKSLAERQSDGEVKNSGAADPGAEEVSSAGASEREGPAFPGGLLPSDLSGWLKKQGGVHVLEPHMREKLRKGYEEHIYRALRLAQQGKGEAAKAEARLAENAAVIAARYMSGAEYAAFKTQMEEKLNGIMGEADS